jgi:hypothetical protein
MSLVAGIAKAGCRELLKFRNRNQDWPAEERLSLFSQRYQQPPVRSSSEGIIPAIPAAADSLAFESGVS